MVPVINFWMAQRVGGGMYDPDVYGETTWLVHPTEAAPEQKTLRVYCVEIEELDKVDDLSQGVNYKLMKNIGSFPRSGFDIKHDGEGNCTIEISSYCKQGDMPSSGGAWKLFRMDGLIVLNCESCSIYGHKKYVKHSQQYKIASFNGDLPYIQLLCQAKRAKYLGIWYNEGDIITLYVRDIGFRPILAIKPKYEQTYVPMLPGQKLQVISDKSCSELQWRFTSDSSLLYAGRCHLESSYVGRDVVCDTFMCVSQVRANELLFLNLKESPWSKVICIPAESKSIERYPIINPVKDCIIYSNDIDGFILRSHNACKVNTDGPHLLSLYSSTGISNCETKVKLDKKVPFFRIIKDGSEWKPILPIN